MSKWKTSLLVLALAAVALAQEPVVGISESGIMSPPVRRVGMRLACLCRSCKNAVGDCAMLQCEYCAPMRRRIAEMQASGKSDDSIVAAIVAEHGKEALSAPPTQGFALTAWLMPFVAILLGLAAIWAFVRRLSAQRELAPAVDPAILDRYHERIEKDSAE
jgi:cytochrome c-type biogenesis protein CcmH/NrfF